MTTMTEQAFLDLCRPIIHAEIAKANILFGVREDVAQEAWIRAWKVWKENPEPTGDPTKFWKGVARQSTRFTISAYLASIRGDIRGSKGGSWPRLSVQSTSFDPLLYEVDPHRLSNQIRSIQNQIEELTEAQANGELYLALDQLRAERRLAIERTFWSDDVRSKHKSAYKHGIEDLRRLLTGE